MKRVRTFYKLNVRTLFLFILPLPKPKVYVTTVLRNQKVSITGLSNYNKSL